MMQGEAQESQRDKRLDTLFKRYKFLSDEFYKNYDNLWKFVKYAATGLAALLSASAKVPELTTAAYGIALLISLSGLLLVIHVKRITVAIDGMLCAAYQEFLLELYDGDEQRAINSLYPSSGSFLRGWNYLISVHGCFTSILSGFAAASSVQLVTQIIPSGLVCPALKYCLIVVVWAGLMILAWVATNRRFRERGG